MSFATEGFPVRYGSGITEQLASVLPSAAVITDPDVWRIMRDRLSVAPRHLVLDLELTPKYLDALTERLEGVEAVVGLGGGTAMDVAKWVHWRRGIALHQIPTLPSVNACFTRMTALRDGGRVRYEGDAVPTMVYVDFELMRTAPPSMLTAGIGDVLSCHTALWDWNLAVGAGREPGWNDEAAGASLRYLRELAALAHSLRALEDDGLRRLMELHREVGWRCHLLDHARFEEGSEHFFAYCFEDTTGRTLLHGELVSLGVLIMSTLQDNHPEAAHAIIQAAGTRHRLDELGVKWDEVERTIARLPAFVRDGNYWFSVAHLLNPTAGQLASIRELVE